MVGRMSVLKDFGRACIEQSSEAGGSDGEVRIDSEVRLMASRAMR